MRTAVMILSLLVTVSAPSDVFAQEAHQSLNCAFSWATRTTYVGIHMSSAPKAGLTQPFAISVQPNKSPGGWELIEMSGDQSLNVYGRPVAVAVRDKDSDAMTFVSGGPGPDGAYSVREYTIWDIKSGYPKAISRHTYTPPNGAWGREFGRFVEPRALSKEEDREVTSSLPPLLVADFTGDCREGSVVKAERLWTEKVAGKKESSSK